MRDTIASRIMRTTVYIDDPILKEIKRLLLAHALADIRRELGSTPAPLLWITKPMGARVDLSDKHALLDAVNLLRE